MTPHVSIRWQTASMAWMRRQETYEMQTVEMTKKGMRWWKTHDTYKTEMTPHVLIRWQTASMASIWRQAASMAWMRRQETYEMQTVEMTKTGMRWWKTHDTYKTEMTPHVLIRWQTASMASIWRQAASMAWMRRQETYEMQTVEMTKTGMRWWKTH